MSDVTEVLVGADTIQATARDQFFSPGVRRAFVTSSDAVFGMARMFATISESAGQTIEVFRDMNAAEKWLNSWSP